MMHGSHLSWCFGRESGPKHYHLWNNSVFKTPKLQATSNNVRTCRYSRPKLQTQLCPTGRIRAEAPAEPCRTCPWLPMSLEVKVDPKDYDQTSRNLRVGAVGLGKLTFRLPCQQVSRLPGTRVCLPSSRDLTKLCFMEHVCSLHFLPRNVPQPSNANHKNLSNSGPNSCTASRYELSNKNKHDDAHMMCFS